MNLDKSWKPKVILNKVADEFYKFEKIEREKEKLHLELAVAYYNIWFYVIEHGRPDHQIDLQEFFIKTECLEQWGHCEFNINRSTRLFTVSSDRYGIMDLGTGYLI